MNYRIVLTAGLLAFASSGYGFFNSPLEWVKWQKKLWGTGETLDSVLEKCSEGRINLPDDTLLSLIAASKSSSFGAYVEEWGIKRLLSNAAKRKDLEMFMKLMVLWGPVEVIGNDESGNSYATDALDSREMTSRSHDEEPFKGDPQFKEAAFTRLMQEGYITPHCVRELCTTKKKFRVVPSQETCQLWQMRNKQDEKLEASLCGQ